MKTEQTRKNTERIFLAGILTFQILMMTTVALGQGLTGQTTLVSSSGDRPSISADGRFVAFQSGATNLVPGDTNGFWDIFVHDRQTGQTTRVSVGSAGLQGNGDSFVPSISADGRFVAFQSGATNLVPGDSNGFEDVFIHDRQTGQTTRVSVDSAGLQGNGDSFVPSISADGRFVAFQSNANNLVPGGDPLILINHIFVHDRQAGQTVRVSKDSAGIPGNSDSSSPSISADGRFVAFHSFATNLVAVADTNVLRDIFVHDRQTGQTIRVSEDSAGIQGNGDSLLPSISADGRFVAFVSDANNLVPGDSNGFSDVFVHDRQAGQTTRVSVNSAGLQGNGHSGILASKPISISADGRFVAFSSDATNLVTGDTNGFSDVFVRDRQAGQTSRVSVDSTGIQRNVDSLFPSISPDGRFVAFRGGGVSVHNFLKLFSDVQFDNPFFSYIMKLVDAGITSGCGPDAYCPGNPVTRGQMAVFIVSALNQAPNACLGGTFNDVNSSLGGFCGFIEKFASLGITGGCGDGTNYCPNDLVTRGQMAVFLTIALNQTANACSGGIFNDVNSGLGGFCGFIEKFASLGITGGCGNGNYCPNSPVTRGQMAVFLVAAPPPLNP